MKSDLFASGNPAGASAVPVVPVTPQAPVYVDTDAVVGWSARLETALHRSRSVGSMIRGGSGEAVQLKLGGEGFVIVRPSEATEPAAAH